MTHCGLVAEVAGDQIVKVRGDSDHPLTRGLHLPEGPRDRPGSPPPGAITHPMMRKDGELVPVSWDEALDDIAREAAQRSSTRTARTRSASTSAAASASIPRATRWRRRFYRALGTPPKFSPLTIDGTAKVDDRGGDGRLPRAQSEDRLRQRRDADLRRHQPDGQPRAQHRHVQPGRRGSAPSPKRGEVWTIDPVFTETAKLVHAPHRRLSGQGLRDPRLADARDHRRRPARPASSRSRAWRSCARRSKATTARRPPRSPASPSRSSRICSPRSAGQGRVVVETGTGITMSAGCNLTQWFAWLIMILTGCDEPEGRCLVPSRLPHASSRSSSCRSMRRSTPGSKTRPDVKGIIGDWPCAVLPLEIEAGNIRALLQLRRQHVALLPRHQRAQRPRCRSSSCNVITEIIAQRD